MTAQEQEAAYQRLTELKHADFANCIEQPFSIVFVGSEETLTLRLGGLRLHSGNPERQSFALDFQGPASLPLNQGTYLVHHETLGHFPLFLVPVGADADNRWYEAIFN